MSLRSAPPARRPPPHHQVSLTDLAIAPASKRTISLDEVTVTTLRDYLVMLDREREELQDAYHDEDRLFCYPDGHAPHPDTILTMFNWLVDRAGTPRIRLHDVRRTYATLSLDAGIDLEDRQRPARTRQRVCHRADLRARSTGHDRQAAGTMAAIIRCEHRADS